MAQLRLPPPTLSSPPHRLVDYNGNIVKYGMFNAPIRDPNLIETRIRHWPGKLSRLRFKQWQHFCVVHRDLALSFAIVDTGYLRLGWVQVIHRGVGHTFEHNCRGPHLECRVARNLFDDVSWLRTSNLSIEVHNHLDDGHHEINIQTKSSKNGPAVEAQLSCHHPAHIEPLVVCLPFGRQRGVYSHKVPLPLTGTVTVGTKTIKLEDNAWVLLDIHKGHYPHKSWWNWATFVTQDTRGRVIAANFTRNVVPTDDLHENAVWVDGRLTACNPSVFDLRSEPWQVKTLDDRNQLSFAGQGERQETLHLGLVDSTFRQRYGLFSGQVAAGEQTIPVSQAFGLFEDHRARW